MSSAKAGASPSHVEVERHAGAPVAPRTAAVLRVLASRANAKGRAALDCDEMSRITGLDALDVEIGLAVAQGRGVIERVRLTEVSPGRIVLSAHFAGLS
ncbi:hypothetical protein Q9R20_12390 [Microbacterium sp. PRF11]|uniref:hypothetical protein n=1 Tax=Microbacterium sp. PRF11 TaxID=2962593 RepID=UPI00288239A6|nr:hypothetical protein [Microbacterium sp. PRF11]MDT0117785.1 hypothetical protein [Microbacterium sp. PRF11]